MLIAMPYGLPAVGRGDLKNPELEAIFFWNFITRRVAPFPSAYCPPSTRVPVNELLDASITEALMKSFREVFLFGD